MQKILYLGIVLMFASCGANVSTIKIDNLEVMTEDLESKYNWYDAMKACAVLGDGWRLPTKDELNLLYENKEKIGGFANDDYYWSSTEDGNYDAWRQDFDDGNQIAMSKGRGPTRYVRVVRAF
jgi:hypothetical protein